MQSGSFHKETKQIGRSKVSPLRANPHEYISEFDRNKKTLVLDLDQTLVYLTLVTPTKGTEFTTITDEGKLLSYAIERPGLHRFIKEMSVLFNICIYTSMKMHHAIKTVEAVGLAPYIFDVYACAECVKIAENNYMKSLLKLGFDLSSTIFMDDSPYQISSQPLNAILVQPFKGDRGDSCFALLAPFLRYIVTLSDVRSVTEKLYAYFEREIQKQDKQLELQKQKRSSKNALPEIVEEVEEENTSVMKKRGILSNESKQQRSDTSMMVYEFDSNSTSASSSESRGRCTVQCSQIQNLKVSCLRLKF